MRRFAPVVAAMAAVPLLAFGPAERIAPTHWAVIIGISDYIHYDDVTGGDLPGAEHDARACGTFSSAGTVSRPTTSGCS